MQRHLKLERIAEELRDPRPGGALTIAHLSQVPLVQLLRCHPEDAPSAASGWLAAIADRHLAPAVTAMHKDPARARTVRELASLAGLSRTAFAVRARDGGSSRVAPDAVTVSVHGSAAAPSVADTAGQGAAR